jgi:hypothetical protein
VGPDGVAQGALGLGRDGWHATSLSVRPT